ncbi:hypothetical protein ANTRET_LOCUS1974 [Anthophora retusa]
MFPPSIRNGISLKYGIPVSFIDTEGSTVDYYFLFFPHGASSKHVQENLNKKSSVRWETRLLLDLVHEL